MTRKNITSLAIVVVIGLLFQAGFVALDCKNTPADTAVKFARAYYRLSPSMAQWMCGTASAASGKTACCSASTNSTKTACGNAPAKCMNPAVEEYVFDTCADAAERGFGKEFATYALSHIETRTEYLDNATAMVHLTAHRRLAINPLYTYVAGLFNIGDTYEVDESIRVRLEDGRWRVCRSALSSLQTS